MLSSPERALHPAIRVLVVDDSVVIRRCLTRILQRAADVEVVATAADGVIALQKIPLVSPDVIVLDIDMPRLDGIETVGRIRESWPRLPIIMCSTLSEVGAAATLRALARGASDYVTKPSALDGPTSGVDAFSAELLGKIRALGRRLVPREESATVAVTPQPRARRIAFGPARGALSVIAIGTSTGGPNALATIFAALTPDLPVPIVVVQHMPPLFTRLLADRLAASSLVRVVEARHDQQIEPGRAYIAPGNFHMTLRRDGADVRVVLDQGAAVCGCRPAVDILFQSAARVFGAGALGVVLTGMGHDGAQGARAIVESGGTVIVQDAASCVVSTMPDAVAALEIADGAYALSQLGGELVARASRGRR